MILCFGALALGAVAGEVTTGYLEGEMDPGLMLTPSPDASACAIA